MTDIITKYSSYFITKCDKKLWKKASGFLLQKATFIKKFVLTDNILNYKRLLFSTFQLNQFFERINLGDGEVS